MKITVIQFTASADKAANLIRLTELVEAAVGSDKPDLVLLPEMSAFIAPDPAAMRQMAEPLDGPYLSAMSALAARLGINLHAGSLVERRGDSCFNTSVVLDRNGKMVGQYSKIHRFDVMLPDGTELRESSFIERGDDVAVVDIEGIRTGLTICYDLRFPELFRRLVDGGASLIVVPAAFTFQTGADHWEILLRARAIESQCFVAAAGQTGVFGGKYMNFGHSMIIDPWGQVIAQASNREGHATAMLDMEYLATVRTRLPALNHRVL